MAHPDQRPSRKKWTQAIDLANYCMESHTLTTSYTFFSSQGPFSKIDHMFGHKIRLSKFMNSEVIAEVFSNHNGMKLETNQKRKEGKPQTSRKSTVCHEAIIGSIRKNVSNIGKKNKVKPRLSKTYRLLPKQY